MGSKDNSRPRIFGSGLIALDLVVSSNPNVPIYHWAGGTCGNVLIILSFLGWNSFPISRLNGDSSSCRVKKDMSRWGVFLDFAEQKPTVITPIIAQQIFKDDKGNSTHKFTLTCPNCGSSLPFYEPLPSHVATAMAGKITNPHVFFFDRLSASNLILAKQCKELGAVIIFEPSDKGPLPMLRKALEFAHIIKYSSDRFMNFPSSELNQKSCFLEIQTLGGEGIRFRSNLPNAKNLKWKNLSALPVQDLVDTCGCGDWTTAGLISKLCDAKGLESFICKSSEDIIPALNYAQALAAWNSGFEGARGGMYRIPRSKFEKDISNIVKKGTATKPKKYNKLRSEILNGKICPSCSV